MIHCLIHQTQPVKVATMEIDKVLTVKEVSKSLACSPALANRLYHEGEISGFTVGRCGIRIYERSVEDYKLRKQNKSAKKPVVQNSATAKPRVSKAPEFDFRRYLQT